MSDEAISKANERLKTMNARVSIERRGDRLWLRATLPPKPHINKSQPYQQKVSLGAKATPVGIQYAEQKAKLLGAQLDLGQFNWADWIDTIEAPQERTATIGEWVARFEKDYWNKVKRTPNKEENWKRDYAVVFSRLPKNEPLTLDALLTYIKSTEPDSRPRKRACDYCHKLAEFANLEGREAIKSYKGSYSAKSVDPRQLPSDEEIAKWYETIKNPAWRWVAGAMICYGLRNHEVFRLDAKDFPVMRVTEGKTGDRVVLPLYPEWAERWQLQQKTLPQINQNFSNAKLGTKISGWFYDNKTSFSAYDLRHCYARRCFEFGLAPDWAAGLMGHSVKVHIGTYRAWIDEATYLRVYRQIIYRDERPLPPTI
ncbi:integrase [Nostocales cyanobacterium HT-58-2]|nr:integrase [Nostocales cyanobacterium HT-58-2]